MAARQTRGRQRIPMRLIQNQDDMYASFSKRRLGLFKKGSELSTLCGADVGIIVFSPTDNPFSFFSPNMDSVVDRYLHPGRPLKHSVRAIDSHTRTRIDALNKRLDELTEEKVKLKAREAQLEEADKAREKAWWEETAVDGLSMEQVKEWTAWFNSFKSRVDSRMAQIQNGAGSSSSALNGGGAGPSSSMPSFAAAPPAPTPYDAEQFDGGQYLGLGTQDPDSRAPAMNAYGGGDGGLGQYLLSSPPLDPFFPRTTSVGGASSSSHVFSPPFRFYMSPDPFGAGGGGGGGESEQYVFPAAAYVDESGSTGRGKGILATSDHQIPYTNFCLTDPVGAEAENPSASAPREEEAAASNQNQGEGGN